MISRRTFLKGLAVFGVAAYISPSYIFNAFKRDYVEELRRKLIPMHRFTDVKMTERGYLNLMFRGFPVTNEEVTGSIWVDEEGESNILRQSRKRCRNELIKFLDAEDGYAIFKRRAA